MTRDVIAAPITHTCHSEFSVEEPVNESAENGRRDELRESLLVPESDEEETAVASTSTYHNANTCS